MLINIYIQAFSHNAMFLVVCWILVYCFGENTFPFLMHQNTFLDGIFDLQNYGWFPITIIYLWKDKAQDPEGESKFCFVMNIKKKYIPWILAMMIIVCSGRLVSVLVATVMGMYQSVCGCGYKLPLSVYRFAE